jgi:hypothetical protein
MLFGIPLRLELATAYFGGKPVSDGAVDIWEGMKTGLYCTGSRLL